MTSIRFALMLLAAPLLGSCDLIASLPVITPDPVVFPSSSSTKVMTARITRNGTRMAETGLSVTCEVSVRLTPNRATAPVTITAVQGQGTSWACNLPASFKIRTNQVLQSQWLVHSGTTPLADSGRRDQMPDCPDPTRAMIALQELVVSRFPVPIHHDRIITADFLPVHGFTSYQGMGVAFVRTRQGNNLFTTATKAMRNFGAPRLDTPDILLFRPRGSRVTDADGPDDRYQLVGWGYAERIRASNAQPRGSTGAPANNSRPAQRRPLLHCVPHHQWFIHSSGLHYADGTFVPRLESELDPDDAGGHAIGASFRPALWYVFFFVNVDVEEAPTIAIFKSGEPALLGVTAPANSFYHPTAYD